MKRLFIIAIMFAATFVSYSQSLGYQDLGILFSQNDNNGTARFTALSGAFGALGGDISSININPAGISVFNKSVFSGTLNSRSTDINTNYYGNSILTQNQIINLSQAGAVLVFDSAYSKDWSKFAIGFNYRIKADFENSFLSQGDSNIATFTNFPYDNNTPAINYNLTDNQSFETFYNGELSELNVAFSSVYQNKLHIGLGLNFYDLNFSQISNLVELNNDGNGNELDAYLYQENFITGTAFSANAGFIYRAHKNFRFGLSYQSPTWYTEVFEESNILNIDGYIGDVEIETNNDNRIYDNTPGNFLPSQSLIYRLRTPSELTASTALIFGKNGFLSLDYNIKYFKDLNLTGANFAQENQFFQNGLKNTHNFRVGTEWRFDKFSIRGGLFKEQTPNTTNLLNPNSVVNASDVEGYSLGGGYNFGNFKLDFSYSNNNRIGQYNFYQGFGINAANLNIDNRVFTATVTLDL